MLISEPYRLLTPADHARALHPAGRGRVTLAARRPNGAWHEKSIAIADLAYTVRHLHGERDVYLTQNRFFGHRRRVSHLAELNALFVDLDYYKTAHAGADPRHVLHLAIEALEGAKVPHPSFTVSTGRGLALIWLHRPVPRAALPRWRACQQVLCDTLKHLGADRLATDAARVLRLVGTRNSRSGTLVEAIRPVREVWDFDVLADEILPVPRAELVALRLERANRRAACRAAGKQILRPARYFDAAGLWEIRLAELQRLLGHRWFGTLPDGQRDLWMLLAGTAMSYCVPASVIRREIVALAHQVTGGRWRERETLARMSAIIARAEQAALGNRIEYRGKLVDPRYRFRTEIIVDLLDIAEAEMRACRFRHLVSPEIRREQRRIDQQTRRRASGMKARADYEASSISRLEPWRAEGISRAAWYRQRETGLKRCMVGEAPSCLGDPSGADASELGALRQEQEPTYARPVGAVTPVWMRKPERSS